MAFWATALLLVVVPRKLSLQLDVIKSLTSAPNIASARQVRQIRGRGRLFPRRSFTPSDPEAAATRRAAAPATALRPSLRVRRGLEPVRAHERPSELCPSHHVHEEVGRGVDAHEQVGQGDEGVDGALGAAAVARLIAVQAFVDVWKGREI